MLPEFLTLKTIYLILHVFGAIFGAGAAFMGDAIFLKTVKSGVIGSKEFGFMKLSSKMVWVGVFILVVSGILLFYTNPALYLGSSKFLVKVTIVAIIIINGVIFHLVHIPHLKNHLDIRFNESVTFTKNLSFLVLSGAISMVSWVSTVILGMLKKVPYSYFEILSFYLVLVVFAITVAILSKKRIFNVGSPQS